MSLSIFDVDGIYTKNINNCPTKIFCKRCYWGALSHLEVEVSEFAKKLTDNDKIISLLFKDKFNGTNYEVNVDKDNYAFEIEVKNTESCNAFIQALEFALSVLKEAKARAEQQKEKAF